MRAARSFVIAMYRRGHPLSPQRRRGRDPRESRAARMTAFRSGSVPCGIEEGRRACARRPSLLIRRLVVLLGHLGEELLAAGVHLVVGQILDAGRDRPLVAERVPQDAVVVAPELVGDRHDLLGAGGDRLLEDLVAVGGVVVDRGRRAAERGRRLAAVRRRHLVVQEEQRVADLERRVHDLAVGSGEPVQLGGAEGLLVEVDRQRGVLADQMDGEGVLSFGNRVLRLRHDGSPRAFGQCGTSVCVAGLQRPPWRAVRSLPWRLARFGRRGDQFPYRRSGPAVGRALGWRPGTTTPETPPTGSGPRRPTVNAATAWTVMLVMVAIYVGLCLWWKPRPGMIVAGAVWLGFLIFWNVTAGQGGPRKSEETARSRALHQYLLNGGLLLMFVSIPGLRGRFLPPNPWHAPVGRELMAPAAPFPIWARRHLGRDWRGPCPMKTNT